MNAANNNMMTLQQAWQWLLLRIPGAQLIGDGALQLGRVHTDSRSLQPGDLFVALKGERFDANDFLADARASGATAAITVEAEPGQGRQRLEAAGLAGIAVPDTRLALGALAAGWRSQFTLPLIAVTGSNGKTTVTQMIASILRAAEGERALATAGNFNNDIGVPLTLLRLRAEDRLAVVELGMNHPGEIAYLADLVRPTVALVNNAQREHLEFMSSVEAVARENGSVISALDAQGTAVFPADDTYTPLWTTLAGTRRVQCFGLEQAPVQSLKADWHDGAWQVIAGTPQGEVSFALHIAGRHNLRNALAALSCALAAGVTPQQAAEGLARFEPVKGRSRAGTLSLEGQRRTLVDDSYNANPDSVRAAIELLAELPAPRLLVLGDMGEVGDQGPQFHAEIGRYAQQRGVDQLLALGTLTRHAVDACRAANGQARHFDDIADLNAAALAAARQAASIVVKGSRFMKMERVIEALRAAEEQQGGAAC